jgi:hypothetical protein
MAWSDEDERQYQELLRQREQLRLQEEGERRLQQAQANAQRTSQATQTNPFSFTRASVGAVRDALQGTWDFIDSAGDYLQDKTGIGGFVFGKMADNGYAQYLGANEFQKRTNANGGTIFDGKLKDFEGSAHAGTTEKVVRGIGSFLVPFTAATKAMRGIEAVSMVGSASKTLVAGAAANLVTVNPVENNLANTIKDTFGIDNGALNALVATEDDEEFEARLKGMVASLPLDAGLEVLSQGAGAAVRAYRAIRAGKQEAKELVAGVQEDLTIKRTTEAEQARRMETPGVRINGEDPLAAGKNKPPKARNDNTVTADTLLDPAQPKAKPTAEPAAPGAEPAPKETVEVPVDQVKPKQIETLDDFTDMARKVVAQTADPARLEKLAKAIVENPHNALDELSIDPLKLDLTHFGDPDKITAMQNSLGSLVDEVAKKTGRTGQVVSKAETVKAARALAMTPKTLGKLMESTRGLASHMTAARMLVGQHAHKLVADVDAAIAELSKGGAGEAYNTFLETLSRHSVLLGTLRGAGSETARALQSLQFATEVKTAGKVVTEQARQTLEKARALASKDATRAAARQAKADAADAAKQAAKDAKTVDHTAPDVQKFLEGVSEGRVDDDALATIAARHGLQHVEVAKQLGLDWQGIKKMRAAQVKYDEMFKDLTTDAGRLRLLNQLKGAKGDLPKLSRIAKARNMTWLQQADAIVQDTRGNLFSFGTASMNVLGAGTMLGLKTLTHALATTGHAALGIASQQHATAARIHLLKTWASVHAPIMAFTDAMSNTWAILHKDGLEEIASTLDTAGWEKAAKELQVKAISAGDRIQNGMIREETAHNRGWYISPERLNAISEAAESWPTGRFGQLGLQWLSRSVATAINVPGSLARLSTSAFINAPDQFAGTLAARVGAHTAAIDKAVEEAAEAGLEKKALYNYIKTRSIQLADGIDGVSAEPFEDGMKEVLQREGTDYAKSVLFQDELEFAFSRTSAALPGSMPIIGSLIIPFPKTPLRILERTAIDYTPLGIFKDRVREAWLTGGTAARGEIAARYTLATGMLTMAYYLASDRTIVGYDGGLASSARLSRGSYTLRIGDDLVEFNRLDPIGTVLGLGADIRAAMQESDDEEDDEGVAARVTEAALWSVFKNVLSKTWMTSLRQLNDMTNSRDVGDFKTKLATFTASLGTRAVPASGVQRQFDKSYEGIQRESAGLIEGWLKSSIGGRTLPVKRDAILGRPIDVTTGERIIGVKAGDTDHDPLVEELEKLAFDVPPPKKTIKGVRLNSTQFSRWLELRGQKVTDGDGLTLEAKLQGMIADPVWKGLGRNQKVQLIRKAQEGYAKLATDQLIREDHKFAYSVLHHETWEQYRDAGRTRDEADAATRQFAKELGIPVQE